MVRLRTLEYEEITECDNDHMFSVDIENVDSRDLSFENLTNIVGEDVFNSKRYFLTKVNTTTWRINSQLYAEKGIKKQIYDGLVLEIKPTPSYIFPNNYQSVAGANLIFNELQAKPIYNGWFYDNYGLKNLDKNTLWYRTMYFKYNQQEDCWLLYKKPHSSTLEISSSKTDFSGTISLTKATAPTINTTDYPLLTTLYPNDLPYLVDTCFVKFAGDSPLGVVSEGALQDFDFDFSFSDYGLIRFLTTYPDNVNPNFEMIGTGNCNYVMIRTQPTRGYYYGSILQKATVSIKPKPFLALDDGNNTVINKTGKGHLSRRFGQGISVII